MSNQNLAKWGCYKKYIFTQEILSLLNEPQSGEPWIWNPWITTSPYRGSQTDRVKTACHHAIIEVPSLQNVMQRDRSWECWHIEQVFTHLATTLAPLTEKISIGIGVQFRRRHFTRLRSYCSKVNCHNRTPSPDRGVNCGGLAVTSNYSLFW